MYGPRSHRDPPVPALEVAPPPSARTPRALDLILDNGGKLRWLQYIPCMDILNKYIYNICIDIILYILIYICAQATKRKTPARKSCKIGWGAWTSTKPTAVALSWWPVCVNSVSDTSQIKHSKKGGHCVNATSRLRTQRVINKNWDGTGDRCEQWVNMLSWFWLWER